MAGELMLARARETGARLLPIDSEHCALHECLDGRRPEDVAPPDPHRLGRALPQPARARRFARITREEALAHPTWRMGPKITIDSATLMNKGLEVIEARWLFGVPAARIEVLVHPQSVVHSMVEFVDGTVLAQLGVTDMRMPIQYALTYPERGRPRSPGMDFTKAMRLDFDAARPREVPLPRPRLPRARGRAARAPAALNAANEEAVAAFLDGRVALHRHPRVDRRRSWRPSRPGGRRRLEDVLEADRRARERARQALARRSAARASPITPASNGTHELPDHRRSPSSSCSASSSSCTSSGT